MSKIQVNEIVNHFDNGAPDCPRGLTVTGVSTFSGSATFNSNVTASNFIGALDLPSGSIVTGQNAVLINTSTPQNTITSIVLGSGTWIVNSHWQGTQATGTGNIDATQQFTINSSASIPSYTNTQIYPKYVTEIASPTNQYYCASSSLSTVLTLATSTTIYLYGGPTAITGSLVCSLSGNLTAVKIST